MVGTLYCCSSYILYFMIVCFCVYVTLLLFFGWYGSRRDLHVLTHSFPTRRSSALTMVTVRGKTGPRDGFIHTDSLTKIVTMLVYLNEPWEAAGGRLQIGRAHV